MKPAAVKPAAMEPTAMEPTAVESTAMATPAMRRQGWNRLGQRENADQSGGNNTQAACDADASCRPTPPLDRRTIGGC